MKDGLIHLLVRRFVNLCWILAFSTDLKSKGGRLQGFGVLITITFLFFRVIRLHFVQRFACFYLAMRWEDFMICEDWRRFLQNTRLLYLPNVTGCLSDNWLRKLDGILWLVELVVKLWLTVELNYFALCSIHHCCSSTLLLIITCAHLVALSLRHDSSLSPTLAREVWACETVNIARASIRLRCFSHTDFLFKFI